MGGFADGAAELDVLLIAVALFGFANGSTRVVATASFANYLVQTCAGFLRKDFGV